MRNKSGLLTLMTAIGSFLVVAALVLLVQFFVDRANTLEESVYSYPNSVWQCEEHDVRLVMDVRQVCYGMTESETLYVEFRYLQGRRAERDFEIRSLDAEDSYEKIRQQILLLNPMAEEKTIRKFIRG